MSSTRQRPWIIVATIVMLLVALAPLFLSSPGNTPVTAIDDSRGLRDFKQPQGDYLLGKEVVRVGIYILSVGNLDTRTGSYAMDFSSTSSAGPRPATPPNSTS